MRRQDIQLLTLARQGDPAARSKAGRRYLVGGDGFPRHVATGIEYLSHPSVRELPETACAIAESLPLQDLLELKQEDALHKAAAAGSPLAQFKLGVWMALARSRFAAGRTWLETAAAAGHIEASQVIAAVEGARSDRALDVMVESIQSSAAVDVVQVAVIAARQAREEGGGAGPAGRLPACGADGGAAFDARPVGSGGGGGLVGRARETFPARAGA